MPRLPAIAACALATVLAACGTAPLRAAATPPGSRACRAVVDAELTAVARRAYAQAASGRNAVSARRRLGRSTALAVAVARGDGRAVRRALVPLLRHQIIRIDVLAKGRTLARVGHKPSYAPVRGVIGLRGHVVGRYVLAVSDDRAFAGLAHTLTGATVHFARRPRPGAVALAAMAYPSGATTISLAMPPTARSLCGPSAAATRLNTIALAARRLMDAEAAGAGARAAVRHAEADPAFRRAVAARDPAALRRAIIGFFGDKRFHIVRVRATTAGGRLIGDVGGPFVLSPAQGTIRSGGAVAGRFLIAVQDDTGFVKLVHRLTGAAVVLHKGRVPVPGSTFSPGPAYAPGPGRATWRGRTLRSYGFTGRAFPSGPLRVSLLAR